MANLKIALTADTSQAVRGINQVRSSLQSVKTEAGSTDAAFGKLKTTLAGLATGAFVASSLKMAQGLNDISKATGIALQNVVGFSQAVQANGGTMDRARDGLSDFTKNIGEAARGQKELQDALARTGVSFEDLQTLSEQDLLRRVIEGLSRIPDAATRSATAMKLFGESMKGVDIQGLAAGLGAFTANAGPSADAIRAAGEASANFQRVISDVQIQLLAALKPLSELAVKMLDAGSAIGKFVDWAIEIGKIVLVFTAIGRAASLLRSGIALLAEGWTAIVQAVTGLSRTFGAFGTQLRAIWREGAITSTTFEALGKRFRFLSQELPLLSKGLAILGTAFYAAYEAAKKFFGFGSDAAQAQQGLQADIRRVDNAIDAQNKTLEENAQRVRAAEAAWQKEADAVAKTARAYEQSIAAASDKYRVETDLIGASEKRKLQVQQLQEAETAYLTQVQALMEQYAAKSQSTNQSDLRMLPEIEKALRKVTEAYHAQIGVIDANVEARVRATQADQLRLYSIAEEIRAQTALKKIQDDINKSTMSETEKKYYDIAAAARDSAEAAIRAEEARRGSKLSGVEIKEYYRIAQQGIDEQIAKQKELDEVTRDWNTGWKKAIKQYVDDATNGARAAEDIFKKSTQAMEDAIVKFAQTGKFEFKSFVNSIIQELLRSQVRQLIAKTFGSIGTGGSGIGSLLGFADGGRIPTNGPVLVGEAGPEIITGAAGRTVIPNNQIMAGGGSTSVVYNINAVDAQSFKQMVAKDPAFLYAVTEQGRRTLPGAA